jgi:hypothetical protein
VVNKVFLSGYEAGYQCALRIFSRIGELRKTINPALGDLKLELYLNGMFGQGREAVYRALMTQDGESCCTGCNTAEPTDLSYYR